MFDFGSGGSEILVVAVVALVVIGPKDLPIAIRTVTSFIKKARQMASEFQTHVDEMVKEANLDDVRNRTVIMLRGTTQALWFDEKMPGLQSLRLNTASDALQALQQDRGEAYAHDAATLIVIAARDPSLRLVGEPFAVSDAAVGLRKNEPQ